MPPETTGAPAIETPRQAHRGRPIRSPARRPRRGRDPDAHADRRPDGGTGHRRDAPAPWHLHDKWHDVPARSSAGVGTARPTLVTAPAPPDATPCATHGTEKVPLFASGPASIVTHVVVLSGVFSPSSIAVSAGAEVTIVFENQDEGVPHNVVVYAENAAPVFVGTVITGPARTTDTFTAPSTPGRCALGCSIRNCTAKGPSSSSRDGETASRRAAADLVPALPSPFPEKGAIRGGRRPRRVQAVQA